MTVVVESKEEVIKVQVAPKGVRPDPIVAKTNDTICWMWPKGISSSITQQKYDKEEDEEVIFSTRYYFAMLKISWNGFLSKGLLFSLKKIEAMM